MDSNWAVARIAERQHGLVTRDQARSSKCELPAPEVIEVTTHRGRQMRLAGVRHHRRSALREVIAKRGPGYDPGGSDRELWVMKVLQRAGIRPPVQQHRVFVGAGHYDIDLAFLPEMVGMEFDSWEWHGSYTARCGRPGS